MNLPFLGPEHVAGRLSWRAVVDALEAGHRLPRARIGDTLLERGDDALLSRSAWIDGLGLGVKSATVMPGNTAKGLPTVQAAMLVFSDETATPEAVLDGVMVTDWKTAGDSLLGARLLARADSRVLTIVGAGRVAETLARGYAEIFPGLAEIRIANRTPARAERLVAALEADGLPAIQAPDLADAVASADIVAAATMSRDPVLKGAWVRPGTHVDLVGGFTPEMREADDELIAKAAIFADCRETVLDHVGDIAIPRAAGLIEREREIPDLYDLVAGRNGRRDRGEITLFKNGGGAHLDLMTARAILALRESGA
ncbi:MAG: NAD(P)-binding domain-containing protein [Nisaea sp.]|uniref:ornithine cyclodeaminase family protein n=1 Tax=Nisaea sp. TaxID=2024842 RepID=UPI001B1252CF|nr:NAD(P)-binding domain-containing protein [Nisaea sp.]MBO6562703.1 NAD(P)-binding domain-containing protein [Nisaea sp.]